MSDSKHCEEWEMQTCPLHPPTRGLKQLEPSLEPAVLGCSREQVGRDNDGRPAFDLEIDDCLEQSLTSQRIREVLTEPSCLRAVGELRQRVALAKCGLPEVGQRIDHERNPR